MSEAATAPTAAAEGTAAPAAAPAAATPAAPASGGFLGGQAPAGQQAPAASGEFNLFSDAVVEGGNFKEGWAESLQKQGLERLANKGKLTKSPQEFLQSLDNALGLVGKREVAGYPNETWSDSDLAQFRKAAGVPDLPENYNLKPEGLPEGMGFDAEEAKSYADILHRHHVPEGAAKELAKFHLERQADSAAKGMAEFEAKVSGLVEQSEAQFRKEWGEGFEQRLEANKAFIQTRFTPEELADPGVKLALSHPKIVEALDAARRALRDGPLPGQGAEVSGHSMSPRQQAQDLMAKNPNYRNDPALTKRIGELYALDAAQQKRRGK